MAKKTNDEELTGLEAPQPVNAENNGDNAGNEAPQPEQAPQPKEATVIKPQSKKVKVHTVEEVDCIIAQLPYQIAKGKDVLVPADVAAILVNSKKAYRV